MDYTDIGLTSHLNSVDSLVNQNNENITDYVDDQIGEVLRPGGIIYSQVNYPGRGVKAVVSLNPSGGAFDNIQTAVNYVNRIGGGDIYITPGTYIIDYNISLENNVGLYGFSSQKTYLNFAGGTNIISVGTGDNRSNNNIISGISFGSCFNGSAVIYLENIEYFTLENCEFIDIGGTFGTTYCILGGTAGLTNKITVRNSDFGGQGTAGVLKLPDSQNVLIQNISVDQSTKFFLSGTLNKVSILDSTIISGDISMKGKFDKGYLNHNTIISRGTNVMDIVDTSVMNITNNNIEAQDFIGSSTGTVISFNNSDFVKLSNNDIFTNGGTMAAVVFKNGCSYFQVGDNSLEGCGTGQTTLLVGTSAGDVSNFIISNNIFYPSDGAGTITNNGTNVLIADNLLAI